MNPEFRRGGDNRRSLHRGWVEDNVFVAMGLRRDKRREPLEDVSGRLQFFPLLGAPSPLGLLSFKVAFKPRRRGRSEETLQLEVLSEVPCKDGTTLVIHSFRPQRPRATTSTGVRCGVVECEVR